MDRHGETHAQQTDRCSSGKNQQAWPSFGWRRLYLSIDKAGRRRWIFMYVRAGKRVELGLGGGRDLSLAAARSEAATLRARLAEGADLKRERVQEKGIPSFGDFADAYVKSMTPSWRSPKHAAQ